jgi:hypothetical protein
VKKPKIGSTALYDLFYNNFSNIIKRNNLIGFLVQTLQNLNPKSLSPAQQNSTMQLILSSVASISNNNQQIMENVAVTLPLFFNNYILNTNTTRYVLLGLLNKMFTYCAVNNESLAMIYETNVLLTNVAEKIEIVVIHMVEAKVKSLLNGTQLLAFYQAVNGSARVAQLVQNLARSPNQATSILIVEAFVSSLISDSSFTQPIISIVSQEIAISVQNTTVAKAFVAFLQSLNITVSQVQAIASHVEIAVGSCLVANQSLILDQSIRYIKVLINLN